MTKQVKPKSNYNITSKYTGSSSNIYFNQSENDNSSHRQPPQGTKPIQASENSSALQSSKRDTATKNFAPDPHAPHTTLLSHKQMMTQSAGMMNHVGQQKPKYNKIMTAFGMLQDDSQRQTENSSQKNEEQNNGRLRTLDEENDTKGKAGGEQGKMSISHSGQQSKFFSYVSNTPKVNIVNKNFANGNATSKNKIQDGNANYEIYNYFDQGGRQKPSDHGKASSSQYQVQKKLSTNMVEASSNQKHNIENVVSQALSRTQQDFRKAAQAAK